MLLAYGACHGQSHAGGPRGRECHTCCSAQLQALSAAGPGAGETRALAPGLPVLVELVTHPEPGVACAAAGALAALLALWPADTAALLLAADNVPLLGTRSALLGSQRAQTDILLSSGAGCASRGC